jgi:hypothetical protein
LRTTTHLVRRSAYAAALALLVTGVASVPALAAGATPTTLAPSDGAGGDLFGESTATSSNGAVTAVGSPRAQQRGRRVRLHRDRRSGLSDCGADPE